MLDDCIEALKPSLGGYYVDGTLGGGGYTFKLSDKVGKKGRVMAIDLDNLAIENAKEKIKTEKIENVLLVKDNFKNIKDCAERVFDNKKMKFDGIVLDLGLSSAQLDDRERGFSFKHNGLLDMSFSKDEAKGFESAIYLLNNLKSNELTRIFRKFGEEPWAQKIGKEIIKYREEKEIKSTKDLSDIIEEAIPKRFSPGLNKIKARIFQALRIVVNEELESLEMFLPQAIELLKKDGILAIVSYHSLEDRIVKKFFEKEKRECICPSEIPVCRCDHEVKIKLIKFKNKKFKIPSREEIEKNPRARSAHMRAVVKI